ncbi:MAG: iron ABC transporter permease [Thermomicrobiales bacterium]|nr:iron ABC transporter permease [Thermomicrobiales bacterium]
MGLRSAPWWLWVPATATSLLLLLPLVYLLIRTSEAGSHVWELVFRERTYRILWNSVRLTAAVGMTTVVLAVPLAWLVTHTDLPGKRIWGTILALPLVIPSYAGALAFIGALGPKGFVQDMLAPLGVDRLPSIYGFFGAWLLLSLFTYPYVYLAVRAALQNLDPSLEEAAISLGRKPLQAFLSVTVPRLRLSIAAGALLAMLYTLGDFGVVTLLRYDAFTRVIYTQYNAAFDRTYAAALSLILVLLAGGLIWLDSRVKRRAKYHRIGIGAARMPKPVKLGRYRILAIAFVVIITTLGLGIPILSLSWWAYTGSSTLWDGNRIISSLGHSLQLAAYVALLTTVLGLPIAYLSARFPGRRTTLIERLTYLGYALPGIVIALSFVFMGTRLLLPLYQTMALLVIAITISRLPEGVGSSRSSFSLISPHLHDAARSLGCTEWKSARRVSWPLARPGIAAGTALVFLTVMKELPITLLLRPTGVNTLATDIWEATGTGQYGSAAISALILISIAAVPTAVLLGRDTTPNDHRES